MIPGKILFCTDFSENSDPARQYAVEYAKAFGATLFIVHVVDNLSGFPSEAAGFHRHLTEILAQMEEAANEQLRQVAKECTDGVEDVKAFSRTGIPAQEIVKLADEESVDLIVMGTHGWTGIRHILLGSVAERVLKKTKCPVLVVRS